MYSFIYHSEVRNPFWIMLCRCYRCDGFHGLVSIYPKLYNIGFTLQEYKISSKNVKRNHTSIIFC